MSLEKFIGYQWMRFQVFCSKLNDQEYLEDLWTRADSTKFSLEQRADQEFCRGSESFIETYRNFIEILLERNLDNILKLLSIDLTIFQSLTYFDKILHLGYILIKKTMNIIIWQFSVDVQ